MISNETLFHKDPKTGEPQRIGLGWLDDSMQVSQDNAIICCLLC